MIINIKKIEEWNEKLFENCIFLYILKNLYNLVIVAKKVEILIFFNKNNFQFCCK